MPGNEIEVAEFLLDNLNIIKLNHLGVIKEIGTPVKNGNVVTIDSKKKLLFIKQNNSNKKADIYINKIGVSIKQIGGSFSFNRLQRDNIKSVFEQLKYTDADGALSKIDKLVVKFHKGLLNGRNQMWEDIFTRKEFKVLLKYLMMIGSPGLGESKNPAELILEAPKKIKDVNQINVYSFDEYFEKYSDKLFIAIRRQWVGQKSKSEHSRAFGLSKKDNNAEWVFNDIVGKPRTGWNDKWSLKDRQTVYFLMIEKTN